MTTEDKLRSLLGYIAFSGYEKLDRDVRDIFQKYVTGKSRRKTRKKIDKMFQNLPTEVPPAEFRFWRTDPERYMGAVFLHAVIPWFRSVGVKQHTWKHADAVMIALDAFIDGYPIPVEAIRVIDLAYSWDRATSVWLMILFKVRWMTNAEFRRLTGCSVQLAFSKNFASEFQGRFAPEFQGSFDSEFQGSFDPEFRRSTI